MFYAHRKIVCVHIKRRKVDRTLFFQINNTEFTVHDFTGDVQFSGLMSLNLIADTIETAYLSILREVRETLEMLKT